MCELDTDEVKVCCMAIDNFTVALNQKCNLSMRCLNILTGYSKICTQLIKDERYKECTEIYIKMLEELKK